VGCCDVNSTGENKMLGFDFEIPCPHEEAKKMDKYHNLSELPDHHPITREEIAKLLDDVDDASDDGAIYTKKNCAILTRLIQGIEGMTCARPAYGRLYNKWVQVDALYKKVLRSGSNPAVVEQIYQIMTS
jgi:hypothetical protein